MSDYGPDMLHKHSPKLDNHSSYRQAEPVDFLEESLFAFKVGTRDGKEVATTAMIMAGVVPPKPNSELITVAQDLVDHDPRSGGEQ